MHADDQAFLRAVCDAPDDDGPRLVYADFLDESGDPVRVARAEFIRLQCTLARRRDNDPRTADGRQRAAALLAAYRRAWNGPVHRRLHAGPFRGQVRSRRGLLKGWGYRRGFIAEVTAHAAAVANYSDELAALGPLERLRVWGAAPVLPALLAAPLLARVRELDLSRNQLTDAAVALLLGAPHLAGLSLLDLRDNPFTLSAVNRIRGAAHSGRLEVP
jgi:uncharacterized protein (TIGR02996 family)